MTEEKQNTNGPVQGPCSFRRRDGSTCPESRIEDSEFCFWHDANVSKRGTDVKTRLEEKVKKDPNCEGYKLKNADLYDAWLTETNFNDADFSKANIEKGHLFGMSLSGADLFKSNFNMANLRHASMDNANLMGTSFENSRIANIEWGEGCVIRQEHEAKLALADGNRDLAKTKYQEAEEIYLTLKKNFGNRGLSKEEGIFFYREMTVKRKQFPLFSWVRLGFKMADVSCGYGEKVGNILVFSLFTIILNALIFTFSGFQGGGGVQQVTLSSGFIEIIKTFFLALYYSTVTFTTLGYGDYSPTSWISKLCAGLEAFAGMFLVALFVIAVYKRVMER
ncbi:MAG: hypothetical protein GY863_12180 [bacterium]|nr:hypothetical protein [bacterium]